MSSRRVTAALFGLAVMLVTEAAYAQRVVVLEFQGDRRNRLRTQVVRALSDAGEVEFVPVKEFERAAARAGFKGSRAHTADAVAAVSKEIRFAAAVDGRISRGRFHVQILDAQGVELWSKALPVRRGTISSKNAQRLAKAITVAAKTRPKVEEPPPEPEPEEEEPPAEEPPAAEEPEREEAAPTEERQLPTTQIAEETPEERERRLRYEQAESHTVTTPGVRDPDLERERPEQKDSHVGPKMITVVLGGTTTWRSYCSRPGVQSCKEYDDTPEAERPAGDTVDFSPQVPYAGFGVGLEFFPLASFDNPANGLGVLAAFSRGFSLTNVRIQTPTGEAPEKRVISIDDAWHAMATYRYYFGFGEDDPLIGYVGLKGGLAARTFEVDPAAQVPLPGSHRRYPMVGADVAIPLAKLARIEVGGTYFLNPKAGPDEIVGYGADATGRGFGLEAGLTGSIWGPIGYSLKFRLTSYKDLFTGQGNKWANGGAAEETYTGLFWGATAAF